MATDHRWTVSAEDVGSNEPLELDHIVGLVIASGQVDLLRDVATGRLWLSVKDGSGSVLGEVEGDATGARLGSRLAGAGGRRPDGLVGTSVRPATAALKEKEDFWVAALASADALTIDHSSAAGTRVDGFRMTIAG